MEISLRVSIAKVLYACQGDIHRGDERGFHTVGVDPVRSRVRAGAPEGP